jgi:hypothetical protein
VPRGEGVVRLLTAGLERFGAPDVEVANAPLAASDKTAQLLTAVAAAIADGARSTTLLLARADLARAPNAAPAPAAAASRTKEDDASSPPVEIHLIAVHPESGDPNDFIARIEPPAGEGAMATLELLESLFGPILAVAPDEATLGAQHERAQRALGSLLARWQETREARRQDAREAGKTDGRLLVRLPFAIAGDAGFESMWVEITGYGAATVTGVVVDEPIAATDVLRGDRVTRARTEVEDVRVR